MSYTIEIQSTDGTGTFSAYVAEPASGKGPALVICQEIFGVNETMRQVADRYAEEGYVAIVPDLFWRLEPGVELDYSPEGWEKAFGFFNNFDQDVGTQDIAATLRDARALPECQGGINNQVQHPTGKVPRWASTTNNSRLQNERRS